MRRRPWPIVLLAFLQLLSPFSTVFVNAWLLGESPRVLFDAIFRYYGFWDKLDIFGLPLLAAAAIYAVKSWSYPVFFAICLRSVALSFRDWHDFESWHRWAVVMGSNVLNIAFATYFLLPKVRATYFNSKLRWWEPKPRYVIDLPGKVWVGNRFAPCQVMDFSEGGAFIKLPPRTRSIKPGSRVILHLEILKVEFELSARVVHHSKVGVDGYGLQFVDLNWQTQAKVRKITTGLAGIGVPERYSSGRAWDDFSRWARGLLTGRGWVPEVPTFSRVEEKDIPRVVSIRRGRRPAARKAATRPRAKGQKPRARAAKVVKLGRIRPKRAA